MLRFTGDLTRQTWPTSKSDWLHIILTKSGGFWGISVSWVAQPLNHQSCRVSVNSDLSLNQSETSQTLSLGMKHPFFGGVKWQLFCHEWSSLFLLSFFPTWWFPFRHDGVPPFTSSICRWDCPILDHPFFGYRHGHGFTVSPPSIQLDGISRTNYKPSSVAGSGAWLFWAAHQQWSSIGGSQGS